MVAAAAINIIFFMMSSVSTALAMISIDARAGILDDLAPFYFFALDELQKFRRRATDRLDAVAQEAFLDVGHLQPFCYLRLQARHDFLRRSAGCADPGERYGVESGHALLRDRRDFLQRRKELCARDAEHLELAAFNRRQ